MSAKKTTTKKPATKAKAPKAATKPAKAKGKKPAVAKTKVGAANDEKCPAGGLHDYHTDDEGDRLCRKCLDPEPKAKKPAKAKPAAPAKDSKTPKARKPKGDAKPKRTSALDAAAALLAETGEPMNTREMIEAMAAKGLWSSPNGKTPWATLYSAILREVNEKGADARFVKADRGKFAAKK